MNAENVGKNNSLTNGLVGYWDFNNDHMAGTKVYDQSGQNNTGTLTNGPTRTLGKLGQALNFDGSNDYVNLGSNLNLGHSQPTTISAWIYPRSFGGASKGRIVEGFNGNGGTTFNLNNVDTTKGLEFDQLYTGGGGDLNALAPNSITANQWQHVVVTWDGGNKRSGVVFYVNGVTQSQSGGQDSVGVDDTFGSPTYIGEQSDATRGFDGFIDDVRIYSRVLSADEIKRLYQIGGGR